MRLLASGEGDATSLLERSLEIDFASRLLRARDWLEGDHGLRRVAKVELRQVDDDAADALGIAL